MPYRRRLWHQLACAKRLLQRTFSAWRDDSASTRAAALAFYAMLSLGPLLFVVVTVSGLFLGEHTARDALMVQLEDLLGDAAAQAIGGMMDHARQPSRGLLATLMGLVTLLFGASGVFAALQEAMDAIWHVEPDPQASYWSLAKRRFLSLAMVLGVGFLLTVSLVTNAALAAAQHRLQALLPLGDGLALATEFGLSLLLLGAFFSALFKALPDAKTRWPDVWLGGALTALLFNLGKSGIGLYLGRSQVATPFGAAGSLVVVLLWVYYAAQILFLGAEFVRVYAETYGSKVEPADDAVSVEKRRIKRR